MGLFDKFKNSSEKEPKEQLKIKESLEKYNVFDGIKVNAIFPEKEIVIKSHDGLTRGVATLGFGLIGLAATSGVKQEKQRKNMTTILQVVEKGIVFKKGTDAGKDLRIPYDNIVKVHKRETYGFASTNYGLFIILLENQEIKIDVSVPRRHSRNVRDSLFYIINKRATGIENEESGWGLDSKSNESKILSDQNNNSITELEKIVDMYQKGLLTEEEFIAMKKKIIE